MFRNPVRDARRGTYRRAGLVLGLGAIACGACAQEKVPAPYQPTRAHAMYQEALTRAGLIHTALGQQWVRAANRALAQSRVIELPYREIFYVDPARAFAQGLRFESRPGRQLQIQVVSQGGDRLRIFVDLFRIDPDGQSKPEHVASADIRQQLLIFEPRDRQPYVLRLQTELLREGRLEVTIGEQPGLQFPVQGRSTRDILSRFGAPRDAGRRRHHGVDIFAPRHTPVRAASRGRVTRVDESRLGGRVIWMRDLDRPLYHYYAHLQTQRVEAGMEVEPGHIIGTVGNSGNARTTRPHLHFGLYARSVGPLDPWDYLYDHGAKPPEVRVDIASLGQTLRVVADGSELSLAGAPHEATAPLPGHTPIRVLGANRDRYWIELPGGATGYIQSTAVEPATPLDTEGWTAVASGQLLSRPGQSGLEVCRLRQPASVEILGRFRNFLLVLSEQCGPGWILQK